MRRVSGLRFDSKTAPKIVGLVGNFDSSREQSAIYKRKFFQRVVKIRVAVCKRSIEHVEQQNQILPNIPRAFQPVAEDFVLAENARTLRVQTKDEPHAKLIEACERLRRIGIEILPAQSVIELADNLVRFQTQLEFDVQFIFVFVDEEVKCMKLFRAVQRVKFFAVLREFPYHTVRIQRSCKRQSNAGAWNKAKNSRIVELAHKT